MQYDVPAQGFAPGRLVLRTGGVLSGPRLLLDGAPAPKGPRRGQYLLRRDDGTEVVARLKVRGLSLDPIPDVEVGGTVVRVAPPLPWYQWLWIGLPAMLVFVGGALGGMVGVLAVALSAHVIRSPLGATARYALSGLVSAVAVAAYLVLAPLLVGLILGLFGDG